MRRLTLANLRPIQFQIPFKSQNHVPQSMEIDN